MYQSKRSAGAVDCLPLETETLNLTAKNIIDYLGALPMRPRRNRGFALHPLVEQDQEWIFAKTSFSFHPVLA